ncbi:hypothetical protein TKK_0015542 [Trichogramma kaykai]
MDDLEEQLSRTSSDIGIPEIRPNQLRLMKADIEQLNITCVQQTGWGKSACYLVPALIDFEATHRTTIIIQPTVSLQSDQIKLLRNYNIKLLLFNGTNKNKRKYFSHDGNTFDLEVLSPFIFMTPEAFVKYSDNVIKPLNIVNKIRRIVIDEVHCVLQWSHFRDSFAKSMNIMKGLQNSIPLSLYTATITKTQIEEIKRMAGMDNNNYSIISQDIRANLRIHIGYLNTTLNNFPPAIETFNFDPQIGFSYTVCSRILGIIHHHDNDTGIIYFNTINSCEKFHIFLTINGIVSVIYTSRTSPKDITQQLWMNGTVKIVIATSAFGLGINKADVRFIIHGEMPESISNYAQQIGRAGRDQMSSDVYLFYHFSQRKIIKSLIIRGKPNMDEKNKQLREMYDMLHYLENMTICRHALLTFHFDHLVNTLSMSCNSCDNCLRPDIMLLASENYCLIIVKFLNDINNIYQAYLLNDIALWLYGVGNAVSNDNKFYALEHYAALGALPLTIVQQILLYLIQIKILIISDCEKSTNIHGVKVKLIKDYKIMIPKLNNLNINVIVPDVVNLPHISQILKRQMIKIVKKILHGGGRVGCGSTADLLATLDKRRKNAVQNRKFRIRILKYGVALIRMYRKSQWKEGEKEAKLKFALSIQEELIKYLKRIFDQWRSTNPDCLENPKLQHATCCEFYDSISYMQKRKKVVRKVFEEPVAAAFICLQMTNCWKPTVHLFCCRHKENYHLLKTSY